MLLCLLAISLLVPGISCAECRSDEFYKALASGMAGTDLEFNHMPAISPNPQLPPFLPVSEPLFRASIAGV
jgi:hypothetical protein